MYSSKLALKPRCLEPRAASRVPPSAQRCVVAQSQRGEDEGKSIDWDGAWQSIQKQMQSQVEMRDSAPSARRPPPRVRTLSGSPNGRSGAGGWGGQEGERIRRAERVLLDLWSNEDFLKVSTFGTVLLLIVFVLVIGPPTEAPEGFIAPPPKS